MSGFDELVSSERRRLETQAAAELAESAVEEARREAWGRDELRAWHGPHYLLP